MKWHAKSDWIIVDEAGERIAYVCLQKNKDGSWQRKFDPKLQQLLQAQPQMRDALQKLLFGAALSEEEVDLVQDVLDKAGDYEG